jgi:anti-sigma B factor antagonist
MRALIVEPRSAVVDDRRVRLRLAGELNFFTMGLLATGIDSAVGDSPCTVIELDIAGVRFLDSAGIRGLLHQRADAERAGRQLVLVNPSDWVRQVLRAAGLLAAFGLPETDSVRSDGRTPYRPMDSAALRAESAAIRNTARATREQAAAQRRGKWS